MPLSKAKKAEYMRKRRKLGITQATVIPKEEVFNELKQRYDVRRGGVWIKRPSPLWLKENKKKSPPIPTWLR